MFRPTVNRRAPWPAELDFDLVVLDLNLPRLDGVAILRFLRTRKPSMPILVLTGRNRVEDRVQCLDLGADDYLGKPFSFTELSARIRALMRRSHLPAESVLAVDDLKLDRVERRVERAGRRIELTSKEFCLLEYLMRNAGRRITRAMIIEHVWNLSFDTCTNVVDVYVNYSTSQVDKKKVGHLALAIQVAFQELGVFPASTTQIPVDDKDPMPFSTVQAIETAPHVAAIGRIVTPPTGSLSGTEENGDLAACDTAAACIGAGDFTERGCIAHRAGRTGGPLARDRVFRKRIRGYQAQLPTRLHPDRDSAGTTE